MSSPKSALLIFPNQLFEDVLTQDRDNIIVLVEDDLFFKQYSFHKQKLLLHRATMQAFKERLEAEKFTVKYIETGKKTSMQQLDATLDSIEQVAYYDLVDDWLAQRLKKLTDKRGLQVQVLPSPAFLTNRVAIDDYFTNHPKRMQSFYEWQRKRLDVLIENGKPVGGKWSYDTSNRKSLPKDVQLPPAYPVTPTEHITAALAWVEKTFPDNYGTVAPFNYPTTHAAAYKMLEQFLEQRLTLFGPYEDAIASSESQLFHSNLSAVLNIGLLTPRQVVTRTLQYAKNHEVPIESLEGFIRQIIGWREYMRATYVQFGSEIRTTNELKHTKKLSKGWWSGNVGIEPLDTTIHRVLDTAYAHHIERLMVLGNAMLLLRIDPDDIYEWFMSLFIDAYDWVMVPNVYAMSQFAAGSMITTKPYVSGSNYIIKMSDYTKGDWSEVWDALFWQFISDYRELFKTNPRSSMMVRLYDKQTAEKRRHNTQLSREWLK